MTEGGTHNPSLLSDHKVWWMVIVLFFHKVCPRDQIQILDSGVVHADLVLEEPRV